MEEIWKTVAEFPDYEVSNLGRVRSKDRIIYFNDGRVRKYSGKLKTCIPSKRCRYLMVDFTIHHVSHKRLVHRLVAEAFIENPNNYNCVNHKDENFLNNCVDNLEWCTVLYNCNYSREKYLLGMKKQYKTVYVYNVNGNILHTLPNTVDASVQLGIPQGAVATACKKNSFLRKKYIFSYTELTAEFFDNYTLGKCKMVYEYDKEGKLIHTFKSNKEAAAFHNISATFVASICSGKGKSRLILRHTKL